MYSVSSHMFDQTDKKMKFLATADSYPIGKSIGFIERFPVQLVKNLKFSGLARFIHGNINKIFQNTYEIIGLQSNKHRDNPDNYFYTMPKFEQVNLYEVTS
jgi:hypothetical protein